MKEKKIELKKKFRQATVLCHPDKVADEYKRAAHDIFIDLKQAYDTNDLKKVTKILDDLEKGNFFKTKSETVQEKDLLKAAIAHLKRRIQVLETEIIHIKERDTYKTIIGIEDWDEYFKKIKEKLQRELEKLRLEVEG